MSAAPLLSAAAWIYDDTVIKPATSNPACLFVGELSGSTIQLTFDTPEAAERLAAHAQQAATRMREAEIEAVR